jgi:hypothetical protein
LSDIFCRLCVESVKAERRAIDVCTKERAIRRLVAIKSAVTIKECAIKMLVAIKRMVAIEECAIEECAIEQCCTSLHIVLFCKSRATEPRISELFATERPTMP